MLYRSLRTQTLTTLSAALLLSLSSLSGCSNLGPRAIEAGHADYNSVLRNTADQQLLLNLVRIRYLERPYFLEVASVTSQFTFGSSSAAGLTIDGGELTNGATIDLGTVYEEAPTVAYQPLQGEEFVRRLLAPLSIEALVLLSQSGWSIERIMRVCVQRANDVGNAVTASGPTPSMAPDYESFLSVVRAARALQQRDQLSLTVNPGPPPKLELVVNHGGEQTPEYQQLIKQLAIHSPTHSFALYNGLWQAQDDAIAVQTRSLNGILYYLSHGVAVPQAHLEQGFARSTKTKNGEVFDWGQLTGDLIAVQSGTEKPDNAMVAVRHRDHWFWIADNDLESKSTFLLLSQLLALQAGGAATERPVLTLPVGG